MVRLQILRIRTTRTQAQIDRRKGLCGLPKITYSGQGATVRPFKHAGQGR